MAEPGGERIDRHAVGRGRLAAGRPADRVGDIDRRHPGMLRRRQGRRRPETLFGGYGILRVVAASERVSAAIPMASQILVAHDGSLQIPPYTAEIRLMFDGVGLNFT